MVWYPDEAFLLKVHERMLEEYGGYPGFRSGLEVFKAILEEVRAAKGIYRKAAILLKRLRTANIFEDANKRTAYTITKAFLEMNGYRLKIEDVEEALTFLKTEILFCDEDDIIKWLKHGKAKERPTSSSRKDN